MKVRNRLLTYEERPERIELAFLVYPLLLALLLASVLAAMFPSAIDFGAWLSEIDNFVGELAGAISLG